MTRTWIVRLLLAATLVSTMAACSTITGPDAKASRAHDTHPWT